MKQGTRQTWLLACAVVGVLALGFAAVAGGKIKTKTFSSGTISEEFGDFETATHEFNLDQKSLKKSKKFKAARVKDVNVGVRTTSTCQVDHDLKLTSPGGRSVVLAEKRSGDCGDYGSGSESCSGTLTVFDDEGETPIADDSSPYAGQFVPENPLSEFDRTKVKGTWRFEETDVGTFDDASTLHCVELEIMYKRKKKH